MDDADRDLIEGVRTFGWLVIKIEEDREGPSFAFTVGLYQTFTQPEVIITGLPPDRAHTILNLIGEAMRRGERFEEGAMSDEFLEGYPCTFRAVSQSQYPEFLGTAMHFYRGSDFPCLQCVWPDREGRWPWDSDASDGFRAAQPLLTGSIDEPRGSVA